MKLTTCILALSVGPCSWALADEPQKPAAQPVAAQTPVSTVPKGDAAKPESATAVTTPAQTDTSEVVNVAATEALIKTMRERGYKPINRPVFLCSAAARANSVRILSAPVAIHSTN
jgi:hypothetical protein